jgi:hypothetical protein
MSNNEMVSMALQWAKQTTTFVLMADNPDVPREVLAAQGQSAQTKLEELYKQTLAECGQNAAPRYVTVTLVKKVLDWVVANRRPEKRKSRASIARGKGASRAHIRPLS